MISPPVQLCTRRTLVYPGWATGIEHQVAASQMLTQHSGGSHHRRYWMETQTGQGAYDAVPQACVYTVAQGNFRAMKIQQYRMINTYRLIQDVFLEELDTPPPSVLTTHSLCLSGLLLSLSQGGTNAEIAFFIKQAPHLIEKKKLSG